MHLIITDAKWAKHRPIHITGLQLVGYCVAALLSALIVAAALYHWVFLKGVHENWPVIGKIGQLMVRSEFEQRDRFLRENLDAMAQRLGEMQAKIVQLDALSERVSGLAGIPAPTIKSPLSAGKGGVFIPSKFSSVEELDQVLQAINKQASFKMDMFTAVESRLFDEKIKRMMLPTQHPVSGAHQGSGYGWRVDPFNGRPAMHTGLDFQAESGTPISAAAGGVVVTQEFHPAYGNMVEIDHGNNLLTRYAHASRVHVKKGDLVKRGQKIAEVGSTGRSTGAHLHFEVLVSGVTQDPQKFLSAGKQLPQLTGSLGQPASNVRR